MKQIGSTLNHLPALGSFTLKSRSLRAEVYSMQTFVSYRKLTHHSTLYITEQREVKLLEYTIEKFFFFPQAFSSAWNSYETLDTQSIVL